MNSQTAFWGLGGLMIGVFIGMNVANTDADRSEKRILGDVEASLSAVQEQVAALDGRIGGLENAASAGEAGRADLAERLDGAVSSLSGQIDALSGNVSDSIAAASASLDDRIAALSVAPPAEPAAVAAPAASTATAPAPEAAVDGFKVGQTAQLLDGKARVFISGMDASAGTVRVAVNGQSLATLGGPQPVAFALDGQDCTLSLDALNQGHAQFSADCVAAAKEEAAANAPAPQASEEALASAAEPKGVGQTAWLLDGKARVFISGLDAEARTARVAVNGLSTAVLGGSQPVTFDADGAQCTLQLDDIADGRVQMSASCD